jgi:2-polyprenyl-3-methyl-5-hydroxy-6-metoxy-1,4-benzoquinol methylase
VRCALPKANGVLVKRRLKTGIKRFAKFAILSVSRLLPQKIRIIVVRILIFTFKTLRFPVIFLQASYTIDNTITFAILIEGGIGDSIIALAWIKEFYKHCGCKVIIDLYGNDDLSSIACNSYIRYVFPECFYSIANIYNVKLRITHFVVIEEYISPYSFNKNKKLSVIFKNLHVFLDKYKKYYENRPAFDGAWAQLCELHGWNRWDELGASNAVPFSRHNTASLQLNMQAFSVMNQYSLTQKKYITLHAGATMLDDNCKSNVKIWPHDHWTAFCTLCKQYYPDYLLIQLGGKAAHAIKGVDLCLAGKVSFAESIIILKHALLHIDGESGLVHLRRQLGGKSVVLFGPTHLDYFSYPQNSNISSQSCGPCMWMTDDWYGKCAKGLEEAECMRSIKPETVLKEVESCLAQHKNYIYRIDNISLFASATLKKFEDILDDICLECGLEKLPCSEHIFGALRTYIHASKQWEYPYAVNIVNAHAQKKLKIADVGGGRGILSWYLARKGHDVVVYDIDFQWDSGGEPDIQRRFIEFAHAQGFCAEFGSVFNIPAEDETFDIVTCISVIEYILWKEYALKEMLRVLKPGGKLILTYDLILDESIHNDNLLCEIFTPHTIEKVFKDLNVEENNVYTTDDIIKSLEDIKNERREGVNIPTGITVGSMVIVKNI